MKPYQSPNNPDILVIPPDPKYAEEEQARERKRIALNGELSGLTQQLLHIDAHIHELKTVIGVLTERLNTLQAEKEEKEARKLQLEKMKGIR